MKTWFGRINIWIWNGLIVLLVIALVLSARWMVTEVHSVKSGYMEGSMLQQYIEQEQWTQLSNFCYWKKGYVDSQEKQLQDVYGVEKYIRASVYYNLYEQNGDEERADKYAEQRTRAVEEMGAWRKYCQRIDETYQIRK